MRRFLSDFWRFCHVWHPVSLRWNSPRMLWSMTMRRERIKAAILLRWEAIEAKETVTNGGTP